MNSLKQAAHGGTPKKKTGGASKKAYDALVGQLTRAKATGKKAKEHAAGAMVEGVSILETEATITVASLTEGYFGKERLKIGPVDVRAGLGVAGALGALGLALAGKGGWARHATSVSVGLLGSATASKAVEVGQKWAAEKASTTAPAPAAAAPAPAPAPVPAVSGRDHGRGAVREIADHASIPAVHLTPEPARRTSRFMRAAVQ